MNDVLSSVTIGITDLRKNPMIFVNEPVVCVLSRSKPVYYTVTPERMAELVKAEEELKALKEK